MGVVTPASSLGACPPNHAGKHIQSTRAAAGAGAAGRDPVVDAIRQLGESAAEKLSDPRSWSLSEYRETWRRDASDTTRWLATGPSTQSITLTLLFELEKTKEWAAAVAAIKSDEVLGRVADRTVGDAMVAVGVQSFGLVAAALQAWSQRPRRRDRLERLVAAWRSRYSRKSINVVSLIVLTGISVARGIRLNEQMSIRPMKDGEVATALSVGLFAPMRFAGVAFLDSPTCLAFQQEMNVRIGDGVEKDAASSYSAELELHVLAAVCALRLEGLARVRPGPRMRELFSGGLSWSGEPLSNSFGSQQSISGGVARAVRITLARVLAVLRSESGVAVALRRFSQSFEPRHEQDRFLDLWIAMESLFGAEAPTEVTFRLSLNAANFVSAPGVTRRELFDWVQKCYSVRSKLVHGGRPTLNRVRRLTGEPTERLDQLSDDLVSVLRPALRSRLVTSGDPDWVGFAVRK